MMIQEIGNDQMPMDREKYPVDWERIAFKYKESIGWECELCNIKHLSDGTQGSCLTVHHKNHDPENPDAELIGLCARCHLEEERKYRYELAHKDQLNLFGEK